MRRARRVDGNQKAVVEALRDAGRFVEVLSDVGRGVPDLLVSWGGKSLLLEVKMPGEKLTEDQLHWHRSWKGPAVAVVRSPAEALEATGVAV
jgi:hypothetical protein